MDSYQPSHTSTRLRRKFLLLGAPILLSLSLFAGVDSFQAVSLYHKAVATTDHTIIKSAASPSFGRTMCILRNEVNSNDNDNDDKDFQVQTWNPLRLAVLRLGFTEPMMTSSFNYGKYDGKFSCAYCGEILFDSNSKYDSGSGWPSFWRTDADGRVQYRREIDGRLECKCKKCSSHLGHVFLDGPRTNKVDQRILATSPESDPRGRNTDILPRFCVNGAALKFDPRQQQ